MVLNVEAKRGTLKGNFGGMNSEKSAELVIEALALEYTHYKVRAYAPAANFRDGGFIAAIGGRLKFPAITFERPEEIIQDVLRCEEENGRLVDVVEIDEINLIGNEQIPAFLEVLLELKRKGVYTHVAGLDRSYRGEQFWITSAVKSICDELEVPKKPQCCILGESGQKCTNEASFSARFVQCDDSEHQNIVSYQVGKTKPVIKLFRWDDYCSPTILVEDENPGTKVEYRYAVACKGCLKVPLAEETKAVGRYISSHPEGVRHEDIFKVFQNYPQSLLERMLAFHLEEGRIVMEGDLYKPDGMAKVALLLPLTRY